MKVNNISLNCQKPRHFGNGQKDKCPSGRVRYKHYEELSDNELMLKSVLKAHKETSQGTKMKLYKAMPTIAAGIIGTTLAITQPGKLSSKIASGVGFLVAATAAGAVTKKLDKVIEKKLNKNENNNSELKKGLISAGIQISALALMFAGFVVGKDKISNMISKSENSFIKLLKDDAGKLAKEINNTRLGQKISSSLSENSNKVVDKFKDIKLFAPIGAIFACDSISSSLRNSISEDISKKTVENFVIGKFIQQQAREDFDKIEAVEV